MARRRTAGSIDLRARHLDALLWWEDMRVRAGVCPPQNAERIEACRAGRPFVVPGWRMKLQPPYSDFVVESDGSAAEVKWVDGEYRRADGSTVASW